jgi:hypothetical protein
VDVYVEEMLEDPRVLEEKLVKVEERLEERVEDVTNDVREVVLLVLLVLTLRLIPAKISVSLKPVTLVFEKNGVKTDDSIRRYGTPAASRPSQYAKSVPGTKRISP